MSESSMTIQELFVRANTELEAVVDRIRDEQFELTLGLAISPTGGDVRGALNSHAYDNAWVPSVLAGKTAEEVGSEFDFLRTTDETRADFAKYAGIANEAVAGFGDLDRVVHLSYGDFPAGEYLRHITLYRFLQIFDFAAIAGLSFTFPDEFVVGLWDEYGPLIEDYRAFGFFPAAVEAPEGADSQTRLYARFGRI